MSGLLKKIEREDIEVVYTKLSKHFGFYHIWPGKAPFICLNETLLEGVDGVHLTVFQTLLNYHQSISADSIYRCFEQTRYFEQLIGVTQDEFKEVEEGPDLIFIGRASRRWSYPVYLPQTFKLIG